MKIYKAKFTEKLKKIFNRIQNKKMKETLMSVYGVLVGNTNGAGICEFCYREIIRRAKKHKLSTSSLKIRLEKLEAMGLIEIIRIKISNKRYKYNYRIVKEVVYEELQVCEVTVIEKKPVQEGIVDVTDIYNNETANINSLDELEAFMFDYDEEVKQEVKEPIYKNEKATLEEVINTAKNKLNELKITKEFIKNKVISNLKSVLKTKELHRAGLENYIVTVIHREKAKDEAFSKRAVLDVNGYYKNIKNKDKAKKGSFCNYTQREYTKEEWEEMDKYLIGW